MSAIDQYATPGDKISPELGALREYLCKLEPLRIPRPKCSGMEFVQTSGRQGFYLSLRRKEQKNGHTPLSAISFAPLSTTATPTNNGIDNQHFDQRLHEATSAMSLTGNGHRHVDQQKASNGRQPVARIPA
jgi:hypothetical protein